MGSQGVQVRTSWEHPCLVVEEEGVGDPCLEDLVGEEDPWQEVLEELVVRLIR